MLFDQTNSSTKKVLLMGGADVGKTSMKSIIFAKVKPNQTRNIQFTHEINKSQIRFLENLELSLWDCGGQDLFVEQYFLSQREVIFPGTYLLIYVFNFNSNKFDKELRYYGNCIKALMEMAPEAKVTCLLNKSDLIRGDKTEKFNHLTSLIRDKSGPFTVDFFMTSILNETLFEAWQSIMMGMLPIKKELCQTLQTFCETLKCDEVVLFEKETFLVLSHFNSFNFTDNNRFEKLSTIIKSLRIGCMRNNTNIDGMTITVGQRRVKLMNLTKGTMIMVVSSDPDVEDKAIEVSVESGKDYFNHIIQKAFV